MPVINYRGPEGQTVERRFEDRLTIGRDPSNDIVLSHEPAASRNHARIDRHGDSYILVDPGSRNGTIVERGGRASPIDGACDLEDGDAIRIGGLELRFAIRGGEEAGATQLFDDFATQVEAETGVGAIAIPPIAPAPLPSPISQGSRLTAVVVALIAAAVTVAAAVALVVLF